MGVIEAAKDWLDKHPFREASIRGRTYSAATGGTSMIVRLERPIRNGCRRDPIEMRVHEVSLREAEEIERLCRRRGRKAPADAAADLKRKLKAAW